MALPARRRKVRVAPTPTVVLVRAADVVPIPTVVLEVDVPAVPPTPTGTLGIRVGGVFNVDEAGDPEVRLVILTNETSCKIETPQNGVNMRSVN